MLSITVFVLLLADFVFADNRWADINSLWYNKYTLCLRLSLCLSISLRLLSFCTVISLVVKRFVSYSFEALIKQESHSFSWWSLSNVMMKPKFSVFGFWTHGWTFGNIKNVSCSPKSFSFLFFSEPAITQAVSLAWRQFSHLSHLFFPRISHHCNLPSYLEYLIGFVFHSLFGIIVGVTVCLFVCFPSLMYAIVQRRAVSNVVTLFWRPDWKGQWKWSSTLHRGMGKL